MDDLRKLAEDADKGGAWYSAALMADALREDAAPAIARRDAAFIAACSPDRIRALLDRAERAERERDDARSRLIESEHLRHVAEECCVEARAERDARPEITAEMAAGWVAYHDLDDHDAYAQFVAAMNALRAHAAKAKVTT